MLLHQTLLGIIHGDPLAGPSLSAAASVSFYSNDFAGRVATKVMQTALAVREAVMKTLDVLVYVLVYFISMVVMVGRADWRLMLPMLIWLSTWPSSTTLCPSSRRWPTHEQASALMTGRIVDSYTNIRREALLPHPA